MLQANNNGLSVQPLTETILVSHTLNGSEYFLGFTGTGTYSGTFKLYVQPPALADGTIPPEECYYVYFTSPSNRTAYIVDRVIKFEAGTVVELRVEHDSAAAETFYGTLLGGVN